MRAIALSTRYIARASAAATSRAASSEATLDRSSLQTVNGLEELWETMEEGGHSVYFSDRVTRKLAAMEKDQAEWVGEAEDEIARLLEIPPEFVGRARLRYGYTDLQEAKPSWDYEHPVNWKVTLSVKIAALDLAEAARDDLIAMLGPVRLRARSRVVLHSANCGETLAFAAQRIAHALLALTNQHPHTFSLLDPLPPPPPRSCVLRLLPPSCCSATTRSQTRAASWRASTARASSTASTRESRSTRCSLSPRIRALRRRR